MQENVVSLEEALRIVREHADALKPPADTESVGLWVGPYDRVLAEEIRSPRDQPSFDRSTRDGYAVRSEDLIPGRHLRVRGMLRAGERWKDGDVASGEAIEIMTGAPLPPGADAVLMVEHAERSGDSVLPQRTLSPGDNVVPRGSEAQQGDMILRPGRILDGSAAAAAASCGRLEVKVYARPKVAILATGDELVEPGSTVIEDWQIYNSNSYAVASLVAAQGGFPGRIPIVRDRRDGADGLDMRIHQALAWDLTLFSGGVSMGKYDLVEQALLDFGAEFFFTGVRIQPGKPVVFGRLPRRRGRTLGIPLRDQPETLTGEWTYFFGLPGNPVSTEVCFHLFAATMLRALAGRDSAGPEFAGAIATDAFAGKPGLTRLLPCLFESSFREVTVKSVPWQGSGDTAANARANAYCVVEETGLQEGEWARVLLR